MACWAVMAVSAVVAEPAHTPTSPKHVSKARQPAGAPVKPSSYAPRPVPKDRSFGAPISTPILRHVAPKKPDQSQPRPSVTG